MTRRRRSPRDAGRITQQLRDIIKDVFDNNGQVLTHSDLAQRHVAQNQSVTAAEDVALYGGVAVARLRKDDGYAIVPITGRYTAYEADCAGNGGTPSDETFITNAIAGAGAGGSPIGWFQPTSKDDWLWVFYIGHLAKAGTHAVFHALKQVDDNPQLNGRNIRQTIAGQALGDLPIPPGKTEQRVLEARLK